MGYPRKTRERAKAHLRARSKALAASRSERRQHVALESTSAIIGDANANVLVVFLCGSACYLGQADLLSAAGGVIAVFGIWRFRRGYRDRLRMTAQVLPSIAVDGTNDSDEAEAVIEAVISTAESSGAGYAGLGTLISASSGLIGHLLSWPL